MSAITPSKQSSQVTSASKRELRSAHSTKNRVDNLIKNTKPFKWTDELRAELLKRYNNPEYIYPDNNKHNVQRISFELKIPRKICSSQIQVLKKQGLKKHGLHSSKGAREEIPLQETRIPDFLSNEEVEGELLKIQNTPVSTDFS